MMDPGEIGEKRGMDSNRQYKVQESRVYHVEERFSGTKQFLRFKAVTKDIVQNALKIINEISVEEMQGQNSSPSRIEKYYLLHHYLDYLNRFCERKV